MYSLLLRRVPTVGIALVFLITPAHAVRAQSDLDLAVRYIHRAPEIDYVYMSPAPDLEGDRKSVV